MESSSRILKLLPALILPGFAVIWLLVTLLLSWLAGWPALASAFPGGPRPAGTALRGKVLGIGSVRENNITTLIPTPEGLYLYPMAIFRLGRAPVLVPWSQIRYERSRRFLGQGSEVYDLGGATTIRLRHDVVPVLRSHGVAIPREADT